MKNMFNTARNEMVEKQLKARGIIDQKVLKAMGKVPRELFVQPDLRKSAYIDAPLSIGEQQTISQPYMAALMTQCLKLQENDRVLEVGTGSGYQTAVLLEIAVCVYSIERIPSLASRAIENLKTAGTDNVNIVVGDGTCGLVEHGPFDAILVASAAPDLPSPLKKHLANNGRMVIPVGSRYSQELVLVIRRGNKFYEEKITPCVFVPLIGKYGWDES